MSESLDHAKYKAREAQLAQNKIERMNQEIENWMDKCAELERENKELKLKLGCREDKKQRGCDRE